MNKICDFYTLSSSGFELCLQESSVYRKSFDVSDKEKTTGEGKGHIFS